MSLLKPVSVEQAAAKVGIFAPQGAGKTTTSALILLGLSKTFHNSAPVAMMDTENGSDYLKPIFDAEGVQLLVVKSRAFTDMRGALREAEAGKCCGFLVDSYTHPWAELTTAFKAKSKRKRLEFHHMDELKGLWREWTDQMLASPLHVVLAGRLGFVWDREQNEDGGNDLVKLGSKMKGESEAGYEPSLLIEMEGIQSSEGRVKKTRAKKGSISHHAYVLKDRWRVLNGRSFQFDDINEYKAGGYKKVFDAFRPHFDRLAIGGQQRALEPNRNSEALFSGPHSESEFAERQRRTAIALEEIKELAAVVWPGQTAAEKKARQTVLECLFGTLSWTAVEAKPLTELEDGVAILRRLRESARDEGANISDPAWINAEVVAGRNWVTECKDAAVF